MGIRSFFRLALHTQLLPVLESGEETLVGGQAVIEGVMMRAPHSYCVAVRKPTGELALDQKELSKISDRYPIFKLPVLRGLAILGQAMSLGFRALQFSANTAMEEEGKANEQPQQISGWMMAANLIISLGFFIFLYKFVPLWLARRIGAHYHALDGQIATNLVDGIIRIAIFLAFMLLLSRMKDIRRVFEYHGAEHKVVFNFESGQPVTIENAQRFSTFHPRCGTSFLMVLMVLSMIVYAFVPARSFGAMFASRIILLPLIVGLSYELIRYAARRRGSLMAALTTPGLWLQRITTQPPSGGQTEIAIRALDGAMQLEKQQGGELVIA